MKCLIWGRCKWQITELFKNCGLDRNAGIPQETRGVCPKHKETQRRLNTNHTTAKNGCDSESFSKKISNISRRSRKMMHVVVQYHEYCAVADLRSQRDVDREWPEAKEEVGKEGDCWMLAVSSTRRERLIRAIDKQLVDPRDSHLARCTSRGETSSWIS